MLSSSYNEMMITNFHIIKWQKYPIYAIFFKRSGYQISYYCTASPDSPESPVSPESPDSLDSPESPDLS